MLRLCLILLLALPAAALAKTPLERAGVPNAMRMSSVPVTVLGITLYKAALYTPNGGAFRPDRPHALELTYARAFSQARLLSSTMSELVRIEGDKPDHPAIEAILENCLRDVSRGDRLTAVSMRVGHLSLLINDTTACTLKQQNIGPRFLAIWLSPNSRSPATSRRLKGWSE
ncbi:hypothetical protein [Lentibacter sp.]|uniref:hypothetical protein n=1 Tax=Lentibacter sp. TaxID=2024994 RepID=UPI003F6D39F1